MKLDDLIEECKEYIEWVNQYNQTYFITLQNVHNFCQKINNEISNKDYIRLKESYNSICAIADGSIAGTLSVEDIITLTTEFFEKISSDLKDKFLIDLNNKMISIKEQNKNTCLYFTKIVDGKKENFCKVFIKYTGNINDVFVLVHEYFHSLTDVEDYKEKILLNKTEINCIQETISILAELACIKKFSSKYPDETINAILSRIYEEIFISSQSATILLRYINMIIQGCTLEKLQSEFYIQEIRECIQTKNLPFSVEHFIGTMTSVALINDSDDMTKLLHNIYTEISNQNIDAIAKLILMEIDSSKITEFIAEKKLEKVRKK